MSVSWRNPHGNAPSTAHIRTLHIHGPAACLGLAFTACINSLLSGSHVSLVWLFPPEIFFRQRVHGRQMISGTDWLKMPLFRPRACWQRGLEQNSSSKIWKQSIALPVSGFRCCCWEGWCHFESGSFVCGLPSLLSLGAFRILSLPLCSGSLHRHAWGYRSYFIPCARKRAGHWM